MTISMLFTAITLFTSTFAAELPQKFPRPLPKPGLHLAIHNKTDYPAMVITDSSTAIPAHDRKKLFIPMAAKGTLPLDTITSVQLHKDHDVKDIIECTYDSDSDSEFSDPTLLRDDMAYTMMISTNEDDDTCAFTLIGSRMVFPL